MNTIPNVIYSQNLQGGDHIFKGKESDLRKQIEQLAMSVDDAPKHHVVTRELIADAAKDVYAPNGEHVGFLTRFESKSQNWTLVIKASAL